jgi:cyanophycin synthetase
LGGVRVFLDYGHNPAGIRETVKTLNKLQYRRIIGCIGLPGDRSDATVRNLAREAANGFDKLYIKEDSDLRGRKQGEIAKIIFEQAVKEGKKPDQLKIVLQEGQALKEAILDAEYGDIIVIFYEKADPLRKIIADMKLLMSENPESDKNISLEV